MVLEIPECNCGCNCGCNGETVAKAGHGKKPLPVEGERNMWEKHPDPLMSFVEEDLYNLGMGYLHHMSRALLGRAMGFRQVAKADIPEQHSFANIQQLINSKAPPEVRLATWERVIYDLSEAYFPERTIEGAANAWALRTALMPMIEERVRQIPTVLPEREWFPSAKAPEKGWGSYEGMLPPSAGKSLEWSKVNGARFITRLKEDTREEVLETLVSAAQNGVQGKQLERQLMERFGQLNRDWRRIAITETAMASSAGKLSIVADKGTFEAVWLSAPTACPYCRSMHGRVFKIVSADKPDKDGDKETWAGKTNVGRSAHAFKRDGTKRTKNELYWPCIPAHPNCCCTWLVRPILKTKMGIETRRILDEESRKRRRMHENFVNTIKGHH